MIRNERDLGLTQETQLEQVLYPTEVLDKMPGFMSFYKREGENNYNPNEVDFWFVVGLSGIGKSTIEGQLRKLIERSAKRAAKMGKAKVYDTDDREIGISKDPLVSSYAWDYFLSHFVEQDKTKVWGDLSIEDYSKGGEDMSLNVHRFKTLMTAQHPDEAVTVIVSLPLFTGARGGALVLKPPTYRNIKVVAVDADPEVLENAGFIRDAVHVSKEKFVLALRERGIILHKIDGSVVSEKNDLTDEEFSRLQHKMGTRDSIIRHKEDLNKRMVGQRDSVKEWWDRRMKEKRIREKRNGKHTQDEVFPDYDEAALTTDPALQKKVKLLYYEYYLSERLGIPKRKYIITTNVFLPTIHFYLSPSSEIFPV